MRDHLLSDLPIFRLASVIFAYPSPLIYLYIDQCLNNIEMDARMPRSEQEHQQQWIHQQKQGCHIY